jgi:periplasmic protein TonB
VLVFGHGAVVRVASALAPGQLIFLTNEKTKKEVVCQVVKSKNYGTASGYIELEFTEPAPGFWGMRFPADRIAPAPAASIAPRAAAPVVPVAPKVTPPPAPVATKPAVPLAPALLASKPAIVPLPPSIAKPQPPKPPSPVSTVTPTHVPPALVPSSPILPPPPAAAIPAPNSALPRHDFAGDISAIFSGPAAPAAASLPLATPEHQTTPKLADPTSEQLKQQASRLQQQLSSLLFAQAPAATPALPSGPTPISSETVQKLLELSPAPVEHKPEIRRDPKPSPPPIKLVASSRATDEEVKIPSWLAPLSAENTAVVTESAPAVASPVVSDSFPAYTESPERSLSSLVEEAPHRSHSVVFGGQLLGETASGSADLSTSGSNKGLLFGIAAAVLLAAGGGYWYMQHSANPPAVPAPVQSAYAPPATSVPAATGDLISKSEPVAASNPVKPAPISATPVPSTPAPTAVAPSKAPNVEPRNALPVEPPKKPALGDVHLAAPVVSRNANGSQAADSDPLLESNVSASNSEPIGGLAGAHPDGPAAPIVIGGDVKPAQLLKSVPPVYPQMARTQRVAGSVRIDALIDATGKVTTMKVLSGPVLLHQAAMDAVRQWKYQPAQLDGNPTSMHLTVTVQFRLQ